MYRKKTPMMQAETMRAARWIIAFPLSARAAGRRVFRTRLGLRLLVSRSRRRLAGAWGLLIYV